MTTETQHATRSTACWQALTTHLQLLRLLNKLVGFAISQRRNRPCLWTLPETVSLRTLGLIRSVRIVSCASIAR